MSFLKLEKFTERFNDLKDTVFHILILGSVFVFAAGYRIFF